MFDVPILINIFRNKDRIRSVIGSISVVSPTKLYIFQDGPKNELIKKELDEALDYAFSLVTWPCDIKTMRLNENHGPAEAEMFAYKWLFSIETRGIILEDDLVPNKSFFLYCKEMLDRYETNEKISYISGINPYGMFHNKKDVIFSTRGPLCGWATWRRFINNLDLSYSSLERSDYREIMLKRCVDKYSLKQFTKKATRLKNNNILDFEVIICLSTVFNNQFAVIPTKNLVMNCGADAAAQNGASSLKLMPKMDQRNYFAPTYELSFPLTNIGPIEEERGFKKRYNQPLFKRIYRLLAVRIRKILFSKNHNK